MKKGMPWASPSFDACTSWIFLGGEMGIPKLEILSIIHLLISSFFPYTTLFRSGKQELNTVLAKSEHSQNNKSEN